MDKILLNFFDTYFRYSYDPNDEEPTRMLFSFYNLTFDEKNEWYTPPPSENQNKMMVRIIKVINDDLYKELYAYYVIYRDYDKLPGLLPMRFVYSKSSLVYMIYDRAERYTLENMKNIDVKNFRRYLTTMCDTLAYLYKIHQVTISLDRFSPDYIMKRNQAPVLSKNLCFMSKHHVDNNYLKKLFRLVHYIFLVYRFGNDLLYESTDDEDEDGNIWIISKKDFFEFNYKNDVSFRETFTSKFTNVFETKAFEKFKTTKSEFFNKPILEHEYSQNGCSKQCLKECMVKTANFINRHKDNSQAWDDHFSFLQTSGIL